MTQETAVSLAEVRDRAGQQEGRGTLGRGRGGLGLALWLPIPLWRKHTAHLPWPVRSQNPGEYLLPSVPLCQWTLGSHPPSEGRSWSGTEMANLPQQESCLLGKD